MTQVTQLRYKTQQVCPDDVWRQWADNLNQSCVLQQRNRRILPDTWQQETPRTEEDVWVGWRWVFPHELMLFMRLLSRDPLSPGAQRRWLWCAVQRPLLGATHFLCDGRWLVITNGISEMSFKQKKTLYNHSCHWVVRSCKYRAGKYRSPWKL